MNDAAGRIPSPALSPALSTGHDAAAPAPRTHRLQFPLSERDARALRVGDQVVVDGIITVTAGLPTHQRLLQVVEGVVPEPMPLRGASLFHLGSYAEEHGDDFVLRYLNPTTSTRFNPYMPRLIGHFGWHAVGGKGGLDAASAAAMRATGCVYLSFLGGGCTLLSRAVRRVVAVGWPDLLTHYRLVRLEVSGLGPATVAIDASGASLYDRNWDAARARVPDILAFLEQARNQSRPGP